MKARSISVFCALAAALFARYGYSAMVTVDSLDDTPGSSLCNLRNAIGLLTIGPNTGSCLITGVLGESDTIVFDPALVKSRISLEQGQLVVDGTNPITIAGSGQIIDAHQQSRVLWILGSLHLSNLTITGGSANAGGGINIENDGNLKIDSSAIINNEAMDGGGIYALGPVTISNSTIANNHASGTGGAGHFPGGLKTTNVTVSANVAGMETGGIYLSGGTALLSNSIITGNADSTGNPDLYAHASPDAFTLEYCVTSTLRLGSYLSVGKHIITDDPMLAPLGDNGGLTPTMLPRLGSPVINEGNNGDAEDTSLQPLAFDERGVGFPRISNGTVDIGAAEFEDIIFTSGFE